MWYKAGFIVLLASISLTSRAQDFPQPRVDNYQTMIRMLGHPDRVQPTPDGNNYIYNDVIVNISGEDQRTILSLTFVRPNVYTKYPGLDVGVSEKELLTKITDVYVHKDTNGIAFITDYQRGLIFWMERDLAVKMVQVKPGSLKRL